MLLQTEASDQGTHSGKINVPIPGIRKGQENPFKWFLKINAEYTQFLFKGGGI